MNESNIKKLKAELDSLIKQAELLYIAMAIELGKLSAAQKKAVTEKAKTFPDVRMEYDTWYSLAARVVRQLIPDRLPDFTRQYRDDKKKKLDFLTYGVADYLINVKTTLGMQLIVDESAALPKLQQQLAILKSARVRFDSSLYDLAEIVQADLFDSELEAATELSRKGFTRAAGAVAGVVLERHLGKTASKHNLKAKKTAPTINDWNQMLKDNDVTDMPTWRFIQHLADIRNLCDHAKGTEPTKEQIEDLISGVTKTIKTLF